MNNQPLFNVTSVLKGSNERKNKTKQNKTKQNKTKQNNLNQIQKPGQLRYAEVGYQRMWRLEEKEVTDPLRLWPHHQKERPNGWGKESPRPPPHHDVPLNLEAICWSASGLPSPPPMVSTLMDRREMSALPGFGCSQWAACLSKGDVRLTHSPHQASRELEVPNTESHNFVLSCFQSRFKAQVWARWGRFSRWSYSFHRKYAKKLIFTVTLKINHQYLGYVILLSIRLEIFPL